MLEKQQWVSVESSWSELTMASGDMGALRGRDAYCIHRDLQGLVGWKMADKDRRNHVAKGRRCGSTYPIWESSSGPA